MSSATPYAIGGAVVVGVVVVVATVVVVSVVDVVIVPVSVDVVVVVSDGVSRPAPMATPATAPRRSKAPSAASAAIFDRFIP